MEDNWKDAMDKACMHPEHNFPTMLYIPPGRSYTHTCPGCGQTQTVHQPMVWA